MRTWLSLVACAAVLACPARASAQASDLNGDGHPDIIWQDVEHGWVAAWLMNGTTIIDSILLYPIPIPPGTSAQPEWRIVGTGDADGDGKPDLFWKDRYSTYAAVWLMDGTTVRESVLYDQQPGETEHAGMVTDVDGDGRADFITRSEAMRWPTAWFSGTNDRFVFFARDQVNHDIYNRLDWTFKMAGAADFDGDGRRDYLWWNAFDGNIKVWSCEGTDILDEFSMGIWAHPSWRLAGVADFNGDGHPDWLWQNDAMGRVAVTFMNGFEFISSELVPSGVISPNWQIVGRQQRSGSVY